MTSKGPMAAAAAPARLNMAILNLTPKFSDHDLSSPHPPSSPSTDSEVKCSSLALHASIAAVPDSQLRTIMVKLAESSPHFHRIIMKELGYAQAGGESPLATPTTPKTRRSEKRRSKAHRHHKILNHKRYTSTATETSFQSECTYHPGNLQQEVYEFLSGSPDGMSSKVVRTITMWSCCDEDEWSPGCMNATMMPAQFKAEHDHHYDGNLSYEDVFPDSDLEERLDLSSRLMSETRRAMNYL